MGLLICKYAPFWQEFSIKSMIPRWPLRPVGLLLLIKNIPLQKGDTCMQFLEHIASSLDYLAIIFDKQFKCFTLTVFAERTLWVTCMHCLNFIMFSIRSLCCRQYCVLRYKTEVWFVNQPMVAECSHLFALKIEQIINFC